MIQKNCFLFLSALCLIGIGFPKNDRGCESIFNPTGWKLPKAELFKPDSIQKIVLPGVPYEILAEKWWPTQDSNDLGTNLPLFQDIKQSSFGPITSDKVIFLTVYKTGDGRIICYQCDRVFLYAPELYGHAVASYVCDLDGDGSLESQFPADTAEVNKELLASIARIRLGQSEEGWLVNRMIRSIRCQLGERAR